MFEIKCNNHIRLTRGDTANIRVEIADVITKEIYEVKPDDVIKLSVKKELEDDEYALQKTITGSTNIVMLPGDTSELEFGHYKYDVQLTTADGGVHTVIPASTFELTEEVTTDV